MVSPVRVKSQVRTEMKTTAQKKTKRRAAKKVAKCTVKEFAPGLLPCASRLVEMGYGELVKTMKDHPEMFAHINQESEPGEYGVRLVNDPERDIIENRRWWQERAAEI